MARIRSIKPEFWTDESVVELSPWARLLFIGLWSFADNEGRMELSAKRIKMQIFPADAIDIVPLLAELSKHVLTKQYIVEGKEYLEVTNWSKHQILDKRVQSRLPAPPLSKHVRTCTQGNGNGNGNGTTPYPQTKNEVQTPDAGGGGGELWIRMEQKFPELAGRVNPAATEAMLQSKNGNGAEWLACLVEACRDKRVDLPLAVVAHRIQRGVTDKALVRACRAVLDPAPKKGSACPKCGGVVSENYAPGGGGSSLRCDSCKKSWVK